MKNILERKLAKRCLTWSEEFLKKNAVQRRLGGGN